MMKKILPVLLLFVILASCSVNVKYTDIQHFDNSIWNSSDIAKFYFKYHTRQFNKTKYNTVIPVSDTIETSNMHYSEESYTIKVLLRHNAGFKFDKLPLEITTMSVSKNKFWCDTVDIPVRVKRDHNRNSSVNLCIDYRLGNKFADNELYEVSIRQLSSEQELKGIESVGLSIEQNVRKR